jgi:hypothetical protein
MMEWWEEGHDPDLLCTEADVASDWYATLGVLAVLVLFVIGLAVGGLWWAIG